MRQVLLSAFIALMGLSFVAADAQAKRLGGGTSSGMKRQMPARPAPNSPPAQQAPSATPGTAGTAATPAAVPKRSWMGPLAGLAAGIGLAALMSHLGLGAGFSNFLMLALLAFAAVFAVRFLLRRFGPTAALHNPALAPQGMQYAGVGDGNFTADRNAAPFGSSASALGSGSGAAATTASLPPGFDAAAFERVAKLIFIRMQTANDNADLEDLRQFATPEMFATFKLDLQDRKDQPQQTDVVQLDAQVLDFSEEPGRQIVSVRFHGLIREEVNAPAAPFDEIWHLVKPSDGSREWAIAGIAQHASDAERH